MVRLTFKNVGQGDSIILEWTRKGDKKIGIIDCNLHDGSNPVLDYIIDNKIQSIEFLILSHTHYDHFSGFYDLVSYCRSNNISIRIFMHTAKLSAQYILNSIRSRVAESALDDLFALLLDMSKKGELKVSGIDDNKYLQIPLSDDFTMEVLSPSSIEEQKFVKGENYPFDEEDGNSKPNANWLSTILRIFSKDVYVLLTSDVEGSALSRIGKDKQKRIDKSKLVLAQVPHHGSKGNLNKFFWQSRKRKPNTKVVISVGKNGYKHPSKDVLTFFDGQSNYVVERTDDGSVPAKTKKAITNSLLLNLISKTVPKSMGSVNPGDKTFILNGDECIME